MPNVSEPFRENTYELVYRLLRARLKMGCVLDIPCGSGAFTRMLLDSGVYRVAAADLERDKSVPDVDFRVADMDQRLPFPNDCFEAVVSVDGVEHLEHPGHFVRECNRVLRPGGLLIVTAPNISSIRSRWRWFLTGFHNRSRFPLDENSPDAPDRLNMMSFPELRYVLHTSGFQIECISTNRSKPVNWLYGTLVPLQFSFSLLAFRRAAKNEDHKRQIGEVLRQMMSLPVLFGDSVVIVATETMKSACIKQHYQAPALKREFGEMLWGEPSCRVRCPVQRR